MERSYALRKILFGLLIGICLHGLIPCLAVAADESNLLSRSGFEKYGSMWILSEELELKRDIDALEDLVRRSIPLKRQVELAAADNAQRWQKQQAANKLIDQIAAAMRRGAVGTDEEKKVQKQIDQLKKTSQELRDGVAPDRLGGQPHMRAMLESLTLIHQQATVLAVRVETKSTKIQADYTQLPETVGNWIDNHPDVAVGPLMRSEYIDQLVRKWRTSLGLDEIPVFLQGQQKRIGIVFNDQFPAIVTLNPKDNRLIVTSNMAFSAGLRDLGPIQQVTLPNGQKTQARISIVQKLRMGSASLQDVSVVVLQPSDEHLGGFLGLKLLQAWNPHFAGSGISLSLDSTNQASTASR